MLLGESQAAELDAQSGWQRSGTATAGSTGWRSEFEEPGRWPPTETGGASRYFPTFRYQAKPGNGERPVVGGVMHPTVKPVDLMRWLVRLVCRRGGLVLDPFAGSGTTGEACLLEGMRCVLVEREQEYVPLIEARLGKGITPTLF